MGSDRQHGVLDEPEPFYAQVVHSLDGIVWEADARTFQFSFVSKQAETILGYPVREWLEDPQFWRRHTHPDDVEWCTAFCLDATVNRRNHTFEYRMIAADGQIVWLRDIVTVQEASDGSTRLVGIMLEITDQKRAEIERRAADERVKHAAEWFRRLIEHAWDTTLVVDRDGTILFASPSVERMLGYAPIELERTQAFELVHPEDVEQLRSFLVSVFTMDGTVKELEYRARHKDGNRRVLQTSAARSHDDEGREVAILNTRDVTEKNALEEQLRTSQKMEAIGLLAGGIAHDFNNLLTVIRGYAEMIPVQGSGQEVEEILRAADRATVLTQQLLAFSRRQVVRPSAIDLSATIIDLSKMLARLIGENIQLHIQTSDSVPPIVADPGQVAQVMMNLAVNARDAMPSGGTLMITTGSALIDALHPASTLPAGQYAVVTVADTGSGMQPEVQARIFEPFFTTKEPGHGTGLGLSTVYGIMQQSSGHIEVRSEVGRGTLFTLYFPESAETPQPRADVYSTGSAEGIETVLLVEDEASVRRLAMQILEAKGYQVLTAANGAEALEVSQSENREISLLITDVVMPGLSGPELAARVSALRPRTRVLYMSGYTGDAVAHRGMMQSGVNFIAKPFTPQAFAAKVREVLDAPEP